jgi:aspartate aminotransferase
MSQLVPLQSGMLYDDLVKLNPDKDWSFVTRQIGMFSFTGLNPAQVENMTNKHAIYMTKAGGICQVSSAS